MKYWIGYAFWIFGTLLLVFPGSTKTFRLTGIAALLIGACIGWLVRGQRKERGTLADVNQPAPASRRLVKWLLAWMIAYVVVVVLAAALVMFGNFSGTNQTLILAGVLVVIVGIPTFVMLKRYGRER